VSQILSRFGTTQNNNVTIGTGLQVANKVQQAQIEHNADRANALIARVQAIEDVTTRYDPLKVGSKGGKAQAGFFNYDYDSGDLRFNSSKNEPVIENVQSSAYHEIRLNFQTPLYSMTDLVLQPILSGTSKTYRVKVGTQTRTIVVKAGQKVDFTARGALVIKTTDTQDRNYHISYELTCTEKKAEGAAWLHRCVLSIAGDPYGVGTILAMLLGGDYELWVQNGEQLSTFLGERGLEHPHDEYAQAIEYGLDGIVLASNSISGSTPVHAPQSILDDTFQIAHTVLSSVKDVNTVTKTIKSVVDNIIPRTSEVTDWFESLSPVVGDVIEGIVDFFAIFL
jgi:hypothetical protein